MSETTKRTISLLALNVFVVVLIINYFTGALEPVATELKLWGSIITYVFMFFSTAVLVRSLIVTIRRRTPDYWGPNLWALIVFTIFIIVGIADGFDVLAPNINWLNQNVNVALNNSMYVSSSFVLFAAVYRRFLATNREAIMFMLGGIATMFSSAPVLASIWPGFDTISNIMVDWSSYAMSAMLITAVFGMTGAGLRTILGRGGALQIGVEGEER
jgi:hypothetical protein